jgi:hypothetical protein
VYLGTGINNEDLTSKQDTRNSAIDNVLVPDLIPKKLGYTEDPNSIQSTTEQRLKDKLQNLKAA